MLSGSGGIGGGGGVWSKPAALVCHICGREYGTTSLKIHVPQCEKMWIEREKLKPRAERRPVPQPAAAIGSPGGGSGKKLNAAEMAAYNEAATKQFNERALVACPNCGRTFFEDRLAIHARSCRPGNEAARVGTGRIKAANEAVAAATPNKRVGPGSVYTAGGSGGYSSGGGPTSPMSPASAGGGGAAKPRSRPSSSAGLNPGGRSSASPPAAAAAASASAPRGRAPNVRFAASAAAADDDDDDPFAEEPSPAPPRKGYAIPADAYAGGGGGGGDEGDLVPCSQCGRNFNPDRVAKHEAACRKTAASDAKRAAKIAAKASRLPEPGSQKSANTEAWKSKHREFQNAIKYARKMAAMQKAGVSLASLPPPPRSENPDYVQCPYCSRRFSQTASERHIASCKNIINKPRAVGANASKPPAAGSMAAQRAAQQQRMASAAPPSRGGPVAARPLAGMGGDEGYFGSPPPGQQRGGGAGAGGYGGGYGSSNGGGFGGSGGGMAGIRTSGGGPVRAGPLSPPSAGGSARRAPSPGPGMSAAAASGGGIAAVRRAPSPGPGAAGSRGRAPSRGHDGGGGEDLHAKINMLTETVQKLSQVVMTSPPSAAGAGSSRRGNSVGRAAPRASAGPSCRSCGQINPVATAKFCPHCGSRS